MTIGDDLRENYLTGSLSDAQREDLESAGTERVFHADDELFHEGQTADTFWILLEGEIELTRNHGHQRIVLTTMNTPGQWAGGLSAWGGDDASAVYRASGRALGDGRCFLVPSEELGRLIESWLPFARHMINGVYQTIRSIDAGARERESLVALGTLAAGLAHEINNPASASLRAVESLRRVSDHMMGSLVELAELGIPADHFLDIERIRLDLLARPLAEVGGMKTADDEEAIGSWLESRDIDGAWRMAPVLAARSVDRTWLAELESSTGDALGASVRWLSSTAGAAALLNELTEATTRIAHLVADVKTYSQMDRAEIQTIDVRDAIESTLAMLAPRLEGIDVVRDFDAELPSVDAFAAELNQVWTNVVVNALDAMGGNGTLRVSARSDGDDVVVEIADTGTGIAPEVLSHIFEPFYTTKDVGKGTGLGLDISRRIIVERHGGDITYESEPGSTIARIRIPMRR